MSRGGGDDELQQIQQKADRVVDESLESTRRMLALAGETQDTGARTLQMLDHQGEQLDNIESGLGEIDQNIRKAEDNLGQMEKCCGCFPCGGGKKGGSSMDEKAWKTNGDDSTVVNQPGGGKKSNMGNSGTANGQDTSGGGGGGGYITRINADDAREDEMDENLGQVSSIVGNLRNMAIDMGTEISSQNRQIDRINMKAESNEVRLNAANERAVKILKK
jgi:synaptosomal-associated protein 25